jgi:hypothetical protein
MQRSSSNVSRSNGAEAPPAHGSDCGTRDCGGEALLRAVGEHSRRGGGIPHSIPGRQVHECDNNNRHTLGGLKLGADCSWVKLELGCEFQKCEWDNWGCDLISAREVGSIGLCRLSVGTVAHMRCPIQAQFLQRPQATKKLPYPYRQWSATDQICAISASRKFSLVLGGGPLML